MGVGLIPSYDPQVSDEALYNGDGKGLALYYDTLNDLALECGLKPLSRFTHDLMAMDEFYMDAFDVDALPPIVDLTHFSTTDGLATVEGLISAMESRSEVAPRFPELNYTIRELQELARSLREAQRHGAKFCLVFV